MEGRDSSSLSTQQEQKATPDKSTFFWLYVENYSASRNEYEGLVTGSTASSSQFLDYARVQLVIGTWYSCIQLSPGRTSKQRTLYSGQLDQKDCRLRLVFL